MIGITLAVVVSGGAIFSPGDLSAQAAEAAPLQGFTSHADFQNDCTHCHAPVVGLDPARCEACHTTIGEARLTGTGLHGKLQPAEARQCETCHRDHQGHDFDPAANALEMFDHAILGFALDRHILNYDGTALACEACHLKADYAFTTDRCVSCHSLPEPIFIFNHAGAFGADCLSCHDGLDRTAGFEHTATDFPLLGQHAELECAACHSPAVAPADTTTECAGCHAEPAAHRGVFSAQDCAVCHDTDAWLPAHLSGLDAFRHTDTDFQLVNHQTNFAGDPLTCRACHAQAATGDFSLTPEVCTACHSAAAPEFMAAHAQQFGSNCAGCHDGAGNMEGFDHARVFALDGAHAALDCAACHVAQTFHGTANTCAGCHEEPAMHAGLFGTECQACHTSTAWTPAQLVQHTFPLDHGEQGDLACATCHTETYPAYTCYACHEHAPADIQDEHDELNLSAPELLACATCHATGQEDDD